MAGYRYFRVLLTVLVGGGVLSSAATAGTAMEALRARYGRMKSVHLVTHAAISIFAEKGKPGVSGGLFFEYWADGNRYRIKCSTDRVLNLASDVQIAYDGHESQLYDPVASILSLSSAESRQLPMACLNPLFMPLDFLSPDTNECMACGTMLQDLADANRWRQPGGEIADGGGSSVNFSDIVAEDGNKRSYRLRLNYVSGFAVPAALTKFYASGRQEGQFTMSDFVTKDLSVGPVPMRLVVKSFDDEANSRATMEGTWVIDLLEINKPLDSHIFTIDQSSARAVWDGDAQVFIKSSDGRAVGRKVVPNKQ